MELVLIFATAFIVGLSGSLMPGPLTAVAVEHALKRGLSAAPLVTLGHAVMEALVVLLLVIGLGSYMDRPAVAGVIGLAGGAVLAWMGYGMAKAGIRGSLSLDNSGGAGPERRAGNPTAAGVLATVANPYWLIWWATIGAGYVALSREHGLRGVLFFFSGHILSDLAWLSLLAAILVTGKRFITGRVYNGVVAALGIFLIGFSLYFLWTGVSYLMQ